MHNFNVHNGYNHQQQNYQSPYAQNYHQPYQQYQYQQPNVPQMQNMYQQPNASQYSQPSTNYHQPSDSGYRQSSDPSYQQPNVPPQNPNAPPQHTKAHPQQSQYQNPSSSDKITAKQGNATANAPPKAPTKFPTPPNSKKFPTPPNPTKFPTPPNPPPSANQQYYQNQSYDASYDYHQAPQANYPPAKRPYEPSAVDTQQSHPAKKQQLASSKSAKVDYSKPPPANFKVKVQKKPFQLRKEGKARKSNAINPPGLSNQKVNKKEKVPN
eukprot:TRINITY_DN150_c0_g1_i1.p2 TRINITY_DN150_c0_g1~~TRINITY_DN150_c0_g1_i1.p2  ORF type:complete len:268 (+),score=53.64 TRINITY_DN150_c0_g1_i1:201-1004(+)